MNRFEVLPALRAGTAALPLPPMAQRTATLTDRALELFTDLTDGPCVVVLEGDGLRETLELMIRQSGLESCFEFLVSNEDVARPKPDPEIYLTAIARLGVAAAEVLIVEDAPHGVEAARRSGAHVCQVGDFNEVDYFRVRNAIDRLAPHPNRRVA